MHARCCHLVGASGHDCLFRIKIRGPPGTCVKESSRHGKGLESENVLQSVQILHFYWNCFFFFFFFWERILEANSIPMYRFCTHSRWTVLACRAKKPRIPRKREPFTPWVKESCSAVVRCRAWHLVSLHVKNRFSQVTLLWSVSWHLACVSVEAVGLSLCNLYL